MRGRPRCVRHPRYRGLAVPRRPCPDCWDVWRRVGAPAAAQAATRRTQEASDPAGLLRAAAQTIAARAAVYGPPGRNLALTARLWAIWQEARGGRVEAVDVAMAQILLKVSRLAETPDHADSWVDLAGYAACGAAVAGATRDGRRG